MESYQDPRLESCKILLGILLSSCAGYLPGTQQDVPPYHFGHAETEQGTVTVAL